MHNTLPKKPPMNSSGKNIRAIMTNVTGRMNLANIKIKPTIKNIATIPNNIDNLIHLLNSFLLLDNSSANAQPADSNITTLTEGATI